MVPSHRDIASSGLVPVMLAMLVMTIVPPAAVHGQCETQQILALETLAADQFGDSVAVSGDLAVIGASRHDFAGSASGAAFVFRRELDVDTGLWQWVEVTRLLAPDGTTNDLFGWAVTLDATAVGGPVIAIGAYGDDDAVGSNTGAVYIFRASGETFVFDEKITAGDAIAGDEFGQAVAMVDGVLVIGSPRHDVGDTDTGAAYVFRDAGGWTLDQKLVPALPVAHDRFGSAVDVGGDVVVVGAPLNDDAGLNSGLAYPFRWNGTMWIAEPALVASDNGAGDRFGQGVAIDGALAIVSAPLEDDGADNAGAVYAFRFDGVAWSKSIKLTASDAAMDDRFGAAVGVIELGPEEGVAVIGADGADDLGEDAGAAYLFRFDGVDWIETTKITSSDGAADDGFGVSVSVNTSHVLVGASGDDNVAGANAGAAYVFSSGVEIDDDCNNNGLSDLCEIQSGETPDCNDNGIPDSCDLLKNPELDANENGILDACEDCNENGVPDPDEDLADCDGNAIPDVCQIDAMSDAPGGPFFCPEDCDPDCNDNGIPDACDVAASDCNDNGIPDECDVVDLDCNINGIPDDCEVTDNDCNGNDVPDDCDIADGTSVDADDNGVPDECELDCNGNGVPDDEDIADSTSLDCNANGTPDECDVNPDDPDGDGSVSPDCQQNGVPDSCDIADGVSLDDNANGVPDECETDCNDNGIADADDIADGTSLDCNENFVPDECDIENGVSDCDGDLIPDDCQDCNDNGLSDVCDIESGRSLDLNENGIPDECEDCNGNGLPDFIELEFTPEIDCNENDVIDTCEIQVDTPGGPFYCTEECDPDCNGNGVPDACDITSGESLDCDENGVPDACDTDCNDNGLPDACDVADGTSPDENGNGIPDECEDCNANDITDDVDIADGTSLDCNGNGVPDECDVDPADPDGDGEVLPDCQPNGIPDSCDIADGAGDFNDNGIPDECEGDCDNDGLPDFLEILLELVEDCNDNGIPDPCDIDPSDPDGNGAVSLDVNGDGVPDECDGTCIADVVIDGVVDFADLLVVLSSWGPCVGCPADLDGDGAVGFLDLLQILSAWGTC